MKGRTVEDIVSVEESNAPFEVKVERELKRIHELLQKIDSIVEETIIPDEQMLDTSDSIRRSRAILDLVVAAAGITSASMKFRSIVKVSTRMLEGPDAGSGQDLSDGKQVVRDRPGLTSGVARETGSLVEEPGKPDKKSSIRAEKKDDGVFVLREIARILEKIVNGVEKVSELIGKSAGESSGQVSGDDRIKSAGADMKKVDQWNAAWPEECIATNIELNILARELMDSINVLTDLVSGNGHEGHDKADARPDHQKGKGKQQRETINQQLPES